MSLTKVTNSMISGAVVSVTDLGAKGDGATDDTSAIQTAIDAVYDAGGGEVWFPNTGNDYVVTAPIKLRVGVKLMGNTSTVSNGVEVKDVPGIRKTTNTAVAITNYATGVPYNVDCILYTEFANFTAADTTGGTATFFPSNFKLDGLVLKGDGPSTITTAVHMDIGSGMLFSRSQVSGVTNAFYGRDVWSSKLEKVFTTGVIKIAEGGTSVDIENCTALSGFYMQGLTYSKMTRCTCDGLVGASAYEFKSCRAFTVDSCGAEGNIPVNNVTGIFKFNTANDIVVISPTVVHGTTTNTYPVFSIGNYDKITVLGGNVGFLIANAPNAFDVYGTTNSSIHFSDTMFVGANFSSYWHNPIKAAPQGSASSACVIVSDYSEASSSFDENGAAFKRMIVTTTSATPTPTVYENYFKPLRGLTGSGSFSSATTKAVTFGATLPSNSYRVNVMFTSTPGGYVWVTNKTTTGFTVNCSASTSATYDWQIMY